VFRATALSFMSRYKLGVIHHGKQ